MALVSLALRIVADELIQKAKRKLLQLNDGTLIEQVGLLKLLLLFWCPVFVVWFYYKPPDLSRLEDAERWVTALVSLPLERAQRRCCER